MKVSAIICVFLFGLTLVASFTDNEYQFLFSKWMKQHNKKYTHDNFFYRFTVFKQNLDFVHQHNSKNSATYTVGLNEFSDQTQAEFKASHLGYTPKKNNYIRSKNGPTEVKTVALPESLDWRDKNAVTPIKNQLQCGGCWAFSTTGAIEGAVAIKTGNLISLSEQNLIDCSQAEGNNGCEGGLMDQGFEYVISNQGLCTEAAYPYAAADGTCKASTCQAVSPISSYIDVQFNGTATDDGLMAAIQNGPVSIAIEADSQSFQAYNGGVYDDDGCGTSLDHGVLLVGYGTTNDQTKYWIVKNSWGTSWGINGYMLMVRGKNECGVDQQASYPVV